MIRDPLDIKNSNIWQKAITPNQASLNQDKQTIIVLGDDRSGKTSFIKLIKGDFDLQTKPTRLIDFFTMKKQGIEIEIYEISSFKFEKVLQYFINSSNCSNLMILLCVDLSNSDDLVNRVSQQIKNIRTLLKGVVESKNIHQIKEYNEERRKYYRFIENNQDIQIITRMPFRFSIIGCKYDMLQKMKSEQRKWICRCLRYLAHTNEANLLFSSTNNMQTSAQLRSVFTQELLGFRNKTYSNQKDHTKALFILTGEDKISEMSLPAFNNSGAFNEIKILEQQLESVFPSRKKIQISEQAPKKQFNSIGLDVLIKKNRKEIVSMLRDKNIKVDLYSNQLMGTKTGLNFNKQIANQKGDNIKSLQVAQTNSKAKSKPKEQQHYMDQNQDQSQQN